MVEESETAPQVMYGYICKKCEMGDWLMCSLMVPRIILERAERDTPACPVGLSPDWSLFVALAKTPNGMETIRVDTIGEVCDEDIPTGE